MSPLGSRSARYVALGLLAAAVGVLILAAATNSLSSAIGVLGTVGAIAAVVGVCYVAFDLVFGTEFES
jgi:hypothetical protein